MALEELDQDRRRYLMQQVQRKVQYWQSIYMTSEHNIPSLAKGRYLAARDFYDWLAGGGSIAGARQYLEQRRQHYKDESESVEGMLFTLELNDRIKGGLDTEESLRGWNHVLTRAFDASDHERKQLKYLSVQHQASGVELWHLERFLKDSFVCGETSAPVAVPRAVVDETEYEDENDEPD